MVVRFNGSRDVRGIPFDWMTEEQRRTHPLSEVVQNREEKERRERRETAMQDIAQRFVDASFVTNSLEATVLFAGVRDSLLRIFLESGDRMRAVDEEVEELRSRMKALMIARHRKTEGRVTDYDRENITARTETILERTEQSMSALLSSIDDIRKKLPEAVLFTSDVFDAFYGVDLLRIKGFQWSEETQTLEIDLIAYQAKSANTTPQMRVDIVKKYTPKFAAFQKTAQVDITQLGEMGHRPDVDLAQRSTEELLKIAQGSGTNGMTDLQKFARRLRDVANANALAQATGGTQLLVPAARIRSVSGRFLGRNERGESVNKSFDEILKEPLPPPPSQAYLDKKRRMSGFFRNND